MAFVKIHQFSYTYPGESAPVLRNIDLSVDQGAFVVIIGKSGSGKSTLGKALAGFLFQDESPDYTGEILVDGTLMNELPIYLASERVAYVQQNPEDQFCTLTVQDEVAFGLENNCVDPDTIDRRIDEALEIVKGLDLKERELATLSGGEKQKIAIASLLALKPDVLILDEPTSNLDPIATKHVFETLYQIRQKRDLTIIIIEHKLSQLLPMNPEIYELDAGEIRPLPPDQIPQISLPLRENQSLSQTKQTTQGSDILVKLSQVNVMLGGRTVLDQIDLRLGSGEFVALMGPNGSGKTTLLETIIGFNAIQSGYRLILDEDQAKIKTSALVSKIGYIFQNPDHQLFTQSVWDEATFTAENLNILDKETQSKTKVYLDLMGLIGRIEDHPQRLSYGEKRRLNLIAAIIHDPQLVLIDELLIGQDLENAQLWMSTLLDYTKSGHTVMLVNHHPDLTQAYCNRVIFLDQGRILVDSPTSKAFEELAQLGYDTFLPSTIVEKSYA